MYWRQQLDFAIPAAPAVSNVSLTVYVPSSDGVLYLLNIITGDGHIHTYEVFVIQDAHDASPQSCIVNGQYGNIYAIYVFIDVSLQLQYADEYVYVKYSKKHAAIIPHYIIMKICGYMNSWTGKLVIDLVKQPLTGKSIGLNQLRHCLLTEPRFSNGRLFVGT